MTDNFSFPRFWRLLATDLASNAKKYSLWLGLIIGILVALTAMGIIASDSLITDPDYHSSSYYSPEDRDPVNNFMTVIFYAGLFITLTVAASQTMQNLAVKTTRINALMLPATQLEKFLSRWLIFGPIFLVAYVASFQVIEWLRVVAEMAIYGSGANIVSQSVISLILPKDNGSFHALVWSAMSLQSLFVLGSTIWPSNSMVKTVCASFVIGILFTIFGMVCAIIFLENSHNYDLGLSDKAIDAIAWTLVTVFTLVNYVLAYFRYREIEIIQRW